MPITDLISNTKNAITTMLILVGCLYGAYLFGSCSNKQTYEQKMYQYQQQVIKPTLALVDSLTKKATQDSIKLAQEHQQHLQSDSLLHISQQKNLTLHNTNQIITDSLLKLQACEQCKPYVEQIKRLNNEIKQDSINTKKLNDQLTLKEQDYQQMKALADLNSKSKNTLHGTIVNEPVATNGKFLGIIAKPSRTTIFVVGFVAGVVATAEIIHLTK